MPNAVKVVWVDAIENRELVGGKTAGTGDKHDSCKSTSEKGTTASMVCRKQTVRPQAVPRGIPFFSQAWICCSDGKPHEEEEMRYITTSIDVGKSTGKHDYPTSMGTSQGGDL